MIRDYKTLHGLTDINTVGELLEYAKALVAEHGADMEYSVEGYEWEEFISFMRPMTEAEIVKFETIREAEKLLRSNSSKEYHQEVVAKIGYYEYNQLITRFNLPRKYV